MGKSKKKRNPNSQIKLDASDPKAVEGRLSPFEIQILQKAEKQLAHAIKAFQAGDFVAARPLFEAHGEDKTLNDNTRQRAKELAQATRPERISMLVGLGCTMILLLIFLTVKVTQL